MKKMQLKGGLEDKILSVDGDETKLDDTLSSVDYHLRGRDEALELRYESMPREGIIDESASIYGSLLEQGYDNEIGVSPCLDADVPTVALFKPGTYSGNYSVAV